MHIVGEEGSVGVEVVEISVMVEFMVLLSHDKFKCAGLFFLVCGLIVV